MPIVSGPVPTLTASTPTAVTAHERREFNSVTGTPRDVNMADRMAYIQQIPIGDTAPLNVVTSGQTIENHIAKVPSTIGATLQRVTLNNFGATIASSGTNYLTFTVQRRVAATGANTVLGSFTTNGNALTQYVDQLVTLTTTPTVLNANDIISMQVVSTGTGAITAFQVFVTIELVAL